MIDGARGVPLLDAGPAMATFQSARRAIEEVKNEKEGLMFMRVVSTFVGLWLMVSVFAWPHLPAQQTNAAVCGMLVTILAVASYFFGWMRYLNGMIALWLFCFALLTLPFTDLTLVNNALCAALLLASALTGDRPRRVIVPASRAKPAGPGWPLRPKSL
jgi:hypothetical protein